MTDHLGYLKVPSDAWERVGHRLPPAPPRDASQALLVQAGDAPPVFLLAWDPWHVSATFGPEARWLCLSFQEPIALPELAPEEEAEEGFLSMDQLDASEEHGKIMVKCSGVKTTLSWDPVTASWCAVSRHRSTRWLCLNCQGWKRIEDFLSMDQLNSSEEYGKIMVKWPSGSKSIFIWKPGHWQGMRHIRSTHWLFTRCAGWKRLKEEGT